MTNRTPFTRWAPTRPRIDPRPAPGRPPGPCGLRATGTPRRRAVNPPRAATSQTAHTPASHRHAEPHLSYCGVGAATRRWLPESVFPPDPIGPASHSDTKEVGMSTQQQSGATRRQDLFVTQSRGPSGAARKWPLTAWPTEDV